MKLLARMKFHLPRKYFVKTYIHLFLAELLQTAELFKWKYFLMKSLIFSQDLAI